MNTNAQVLAVIDQAFGRVKKPEHFTDHQHCQECAEHDEVLRSHNRDTLEVKLIESPSGNPLIFSSAQGVAYYMPKLARFILGTPVNASFAQTFFFVLVSGGAYNGLLSFCDTGQRAAIASLLHHLIEMRSREISLHHLDDELCEAHTIWSNR